MHRIVGNGGRHPYSLFLLCEISIIDDCVYIEFVEVLYDCENFIMPLLSFC